MLWGGGVYRKGLGRQEWKIRVNKAKFRGSENIKLGKGIKMGVGV